MAKVRSNVAQITTNLRPTVAEINLQAIRKNVRFVVEKVSPAEVMAVVKANAYGHGAVEVAKAALQANAKYLGVATLEEGIHLRGNGFVCPIIVLGSFSIEQAAVFSQYKLSAVVQEEAQLQALSEAVGKNQQTVDIHLKIDTGMGRLGCRFEQSLAFIRQAFQCNGLFVAGLLTHFACSDWRDKSFTNLQLQRFEGIVAKIEAEGFDVPLKHAANSGAILDFPQSNLNLVRLGLSMYGYYPSDETSRYSELEPALTWKSKVLFIKDVKAGESVSYNRQYIAETDIKIAIVPVGYADGYRRGLSNKAEALIRGKRFRIAGMVCMDQIMVVVNSDIQVGDEVVLMGRQGGGEVSIYELAKILNTIPYEITTGISSRAPRTYVNY